MSDTSATSGQLLADLQGLAHLPQLLTDVKTGVLTLKALITTPAAAVATGSPAASGAIVLLGAELAMFLAQTIQAVEEDINALVGVRQNYESNEQDLATEANRGQTVIDGVRGPSCPHVGGQPSAPGGAMPPANPSPSVPATPGVGTPTMPTTSGGGDGGGGGVPPWSPGGSSWPGTPPFVPPTSGGGDGGGVPPWSPGGSSWPGTPPFVPTQPGAHVPPSVPSTGGAAPPIGPTPTPPASGIPPAVPQPVECPGELPATPLPADPAPPATDAHDGSPTGEFAVDPSRRDDLLDAGHLAIDGLVDLVEVVGERIECQAPPTSP